MSQQERSQLQSRAKSLKLSEQGDRGLPGRPMDGSVADGSSNDSGSGHGLSQVDVQLPSIGRGPGGGSSLLEPLINKDAAHGQLDMVEEERARRTRLERIQKNF